MTRYNQQRGVPLGNCSSTPCSAIPEGPSVDVWSAHNNTLQLARLGGVLNAFEAHAAKSHDRLDGLSTVYRKTNYNRADEVLVKTLVKEMLVKL